MHDPDHMPGQPLDLDHATRDSTLLRWALTGGSQDGDAASAVYGTILAASILIAIDGRAWVVFVTLIVTGAVFWLAHAHVALMRRVVRNGEHVGVRQVTRALTEEWPVLQASFSPAAPLLLAMAGLIGTTTAQELGIAICFVGLVAWGVVVSRAARLPRSQAAIAIGVNVGLGVLLILLKAILH